MAEQTLNLDLPGLTPEPQLHPGDNSGGLRVQAPQELNRLIKGKGEYIGDEDVMSRVGVGGPPVGSAAVSYKALHSGRH